MLPRWFSVVFVDEFAEASLRDLPRLSADLESDSYKPKRAAKLKEQRDMALILLHRRAVDFGKRERLNFFQKARLSKQLQDGLIRSGQSTEFAKDFAVRVIAELK